MSEEFITGLITGVIATSIGFGFTMLWDLWKINREQNQKTDSVLLAVEHELQENIEIGKANKELLEAELPVLKKGNYLIIATLPFKKEIWGLLKLNLPNKLLKNEAMLRKLSSITMTISHLNEGMNSRQVYRDTSSNNTAFSDNMKGRNSMLISEIEELLENIDMAITELNKKANKSVKQTD